jgi:hypothetical protein
VNLFRPHNHGILSPRDLPAEERKKNAAARNQWGAPTPKSKPRLKSAPYIQITSFHTSVHFSKSFEGHFSGV